MARAREPNTGISPIISPSFLLFHLNSVHFPKAPTGPASADLPSAISEITPVEPIRITNIIYGIKKVIPP